MGARAENLEQFAIDVILGRRHGVRAPLCFGLCFTGSRSSTRGSCSSGFFFIAIAFCASARSAVSSSALEISPWAAPAKRRSSRSLRGPCGPAAGASRSSAAATRACRVPFRGNGGSASGEKIRQPPRIVSDGKALLLDSLTAGDEPYMLANNLKDVIVLVDKDRVKSGLFAIKELKADTLLLDDGLQYLHLKHRLDIVLIDRQAPLETSISCRAARCANRRGTCSGRATSSSPRAPASRTTT